jgi:hypothetical protein
VKKWMNNKQNRAKQNWIQIQKQTMQNVDENYEELQNSVWKNQEKLGKIELA